MSILVKGMKIPENCFECPFMLHRSFCLVNTKIEFTDNEYSELKGRYIGCPLVEVPTPHGDLIEQGVAVQVAMEWCPDDDGSVGKIGDLRELLDEIEALPIIIESEEGT